MQEFDGDAFAQDFSNCTPQTNSSTLTDGIIPGLNTACASFTFFARDIGDIENGEGDDTWTFFGIDGKGNNIQVTGVVTRVSAFQSKSFTFNCNQELIKGPIGFERLILKLGEMENCVLRLIRLKPGTPVEISTNMQTGPQASIHVDSVGNKTNVNGEIEYTISAIKRGIDWIAWAVPNENGEFKFDKEAYDSGRAWGMFVEVK